MSGLVVTGLRKSFGASAVLRGIDLEVPAGTLCSVLGPSGSGKTTLLRVIAGFERADAGSVRLADVVLEDEGHFLAPDRRRVGYVPQEGSLFPHLSVEANIAFGLPRRGRRGRRVADLLEMVGLAGFERRYPHELSGGEQQRVALARALAVAPALVLLDEPFSALDASLRAALRHDVRRVLAEANATAVFVTHDRDEALSLSDVVAIIDGGRIGQADTPEILYTRPRSPALARGLGDVNLLAGIGRGAAVETAIGLLALEDPARADGTSLVVLVRPEQIELVRATDGGAPARVVEREYYGHDAIVRLRGEWDAGAVLTARVSDLSALPEPGETVALKVRGRVLAWASGEDARPPT